MSDIAHPQNIEAQARYIRDQIMTPEQRTRARSDVLSTSEAAWNSAWLSLELQDEIVPELTITAVRMAVAGEYHCADSTIRRREQVAAHFHGEYAYRRGVIAAHPDLTFEYWKAAASATHLPDRFESMLDIVAQIETEKERRGELPLIPEVRSWVNIDGDEYIKSVHIARTDGILAQMDKVKVDGYAPAELRDLIGYCQALIQSYRETGISPLLTNPIRKEVSPTT